VIEQDLAAARGPSASLVAAARRPCAKCQDRQGGLDDPRAGRSWECPGCRKEYDVGEYATAVRRDLLENGDQGDGWIHVTRGRDRGDRRGRDGRHRRRAGAEVGPSPQAPRART
jgi:hypothetical protein